MREKYSSESITVLEGLDAVRMRPGMYIGTTGSSGMHHLLWEIVDNAIDEAANGFADEVIITLHSDGSASVWDNGRGLPTDIHPKLNKSGLEIIFTVLHAGGKFGNANYSYSGGLHGVGASVVNALSEKTQVDSFRDFEHYRMEFSLVKNEKTGESHAGVVTMPLTKLSNTRKRGSLVRFWPDRSIFIDCEFNHDRIEKRARELAYLNKGIKITLIDENSREKGEASFQYMGGIEDYMAYLNLDKDKLNEKPIYIYDKKDDVILEAVIQYTDSFTESVFSFVNSIPTPDGGTHETGFKSAITKVFNEYARKQGLLKEKDSNLAGEDLREGMTAVITCKIKNPQFEGQTKGRLGNIDVRPVIEAMTINQMTAFLENLSNEEVSSKIVEKAIKAFKAREAAKKAKDEIRATTQKELTPLVGKLSSCTGKKAEENELFIVEGDSAGGSAKQGRDRRFQAILPLRGKPLNVEKKNLQQVLANEEFRSIITALGTGIDRNFDLNSLKYNKVIILSDADQDGAHIRAILLTFFFRYMRPLLANGHVYIGMPPLYQIKTNQESEYAYDDKELERKLPKAKKYTLQRYKGLGEMNAEQLWATTMDPRQRKLMQVSLEDGAEADRLISILMGDKIDSRKAYISEHADFNKHDNFESKV